MKIFKIFKPEKGAVLVTGLMFLAVLSLIGSSAYLTTSNELKISRNYRLTKKAFYDAEAGAEFALARLEGYLEAGTPTLPGVGSTMGWPTGDDTPPTGFNFTLSAIAGTDATNNWVINSTGGDAASNASSEVEVRFQRTTESVFSRAGHGTNSVTLNNGAGVYSYDASTTPSPTPSDSTGEGDVCSNGTVTDHGATVDGDIVNNEGIDPDPLGINDGGAYDPSTYSASNDNAWGGVGTTIGGTTTLCGKPGGADYYFTDITLYNGDTLYIDTDNSTAACSSLGAGGPVNIWHDNTSGIIDFKNSSTIDIDTNLPTNLGIYSNSTSKIDFKNSGDFKGFVYAPYADIDTKNGSVFYGGLFGKTLDMKASSTLYYDTNLRTGGPTYLTDSVNIYSWRYLRN